MCVCVCVCVRVSVLESESINTMARNGKMICEHKLQREKEREVVRSRKILIYNVIQQLPS